MIVYAAVPDAARFGRPPDVTRSLAATDEARAVRESESLDTAALAVYLRERLPAAVRERRSHVQRPADALDLSAPMELLQFPGGHSNLTYLVRFGAGELVVRRPPFGPVAPRAHDMAREFTWLAALHAVFPLAPEPVLLCDDPGVIGATFYVMERRRGVIVRREEPGTLAGSAGARRRVSEALVDTLAALHRVDVTTGPLAGLGKPAGFVARQVAGWSERWRRSKTDEVAQMDDLAAWLAGHLPPDAQPSSVVHGDFKLDNVMLDASDPGRVVAVLDWEMSALGDPLVDVGIFLTYWTAPQGEDALTTVTGGLGWLAREEIVERYARISGRDLSAIRFYEIFARFKIAVVIQQIYARFVTGQTDDPRFARFGPRVLALARQAAELAAG